LLPYFPRQRKLWVDGGYSGAGFANWGRQCRPKLAVEVIKRTDELTGFRVLPKHWVAERTLAWLV
jgi:transposase